MTNPKLKKLFQIAGDILNLYAESVDSNPLDPTFSITPYYDNTEKNTEVVSISFERCALDYTFVEPLAAKLAKTNIKWEIIREEGSFQISIYY